MNKYIDVDANVRESEERLRSSDRERREWIKSEQACGRMPKVLYRNEFGYPSIHRGRWGRYYP